MKLSKKVIAAFSAAAALAVAGTFVGCSDDSEDDPEGAITGSNNNYTIAYDNPNGYKLDEVDPKANSTGVYRAWKRTANKHLGALTKITFNKGKKWENGNSTDVDADKNCGVLGFAWDLTGDTDSASETFNLVGVRNNNGTFQAYVSRYFNVTDKQANNFGATTLDAKGENAAIAASAVATNAGTYEWDISNGFINLTGITATDGVANVWVDVAVVEAGEGGAVTSSKASAPTKAIIESESPAVGSWVVVFYAESPKTNTSATEIDHVTIPAATAAKVGSGYTGEENVTWAETLKAQAIGGSGKKQAVYGNVYKGFSVSGAWNYEDTYYADEVVEE